MQTLSRQEDIGFVFLMLLWRGPRILTRRLWTFVYRRAMAQCGEGTSIAPGVYIDRPKRVIVGAGCFIGQNVMIGAEIIDGQLVIADNVQISRDCSIDYSGGVQIGSRTLISPNVRILSHDHGYDPRSEPTPFPLKIADDVWIGIGALILPGTESVGQNAIIGAGAIVTHPVPDGAIVAGNPAKVIKYRPRD